MTPTFIYESSIPLIVNNGFEGGEVETIAEISYHHDGTWNIEAVGIEISRSKTAFEQAADTRSRDRMIRKPHWLDPSDQLHMTLYDSLEHRCRAHVQEEVRKHIKRDWENEADAAADYQRDMRRAS